MAYSILQKNSNSPPFILYQYTYKFAKCILNGYEMLFQGEEDECIKYLKKIRI